MNILSARPSKRALVGLAALAAPVALAVPVALLVATPAAPASADWYCTTGNAYWVCYPYPPKDLMTPDANRDLDIGALG